MSLQEVEHVDVYHEEGNFAGWPANHGIWSWGDEVVVGFLQGTLEPKDVPGHKIAYNLPSYCVQSRSLDGGRTWSFEKPPEIASPFTEEAAVFEGGLDFTDPELAIRMVPNGSHAGATTRFYFSTDRCHSWNGPYLVPDMGLTGVTARTEMMVLNQDEALLFFSCPKSDGYEGRACCALIRGGGASFEFLSYIGEEPPGFTIMPAAHMREDGSIVVILREEDRFDNPNLRRRLSQYVSHDRGKTWTYDLMIDEAPALNPPALKQMKDGRLCVVYGYRVEPYGMRCCISEDEGRSWGEPIILRSDGGCDDLGYPRMVVLPDGDLLTAYYYNTDAKRERFIAATRFSVAR